MKLSKRLISSTVVALCALLAVGASATMVLHLSGVTLEPQY